jgi:hypothetical protein
MHIVIDGNKFFEVLMLFRKNIDSTFIVFISLCNGRMTLNILEQLGSKIDIDPKKQKQN